MLGEARAFVRNRACGMARGAAYGTKYRVAFVMVIDPNSGYGATWHCLMYEGIGAHLAHVGMGRGCGVWVYRMVVGYTTCSPWGWHMDVANG